MTGCAVVFSAPRSLPAAGSVAPYANRSPSSAIRVSHSFFCSGVAPTVMGSLPRNVANSAVATPRSTRASSSHTRYTSNELPPIPPYSSGTNSNEMPSSSPLMARTTSSGHSSRSSRSSSTWSGSRSAVNSRMASNVMESVSASIPFITRLLPCAPLRASREMSGRNWAGRPGDRGTFGPFSAESRSLAVPRDRGLEQEDPDVPGHVAHHQSAHGHAGGGRPPPPAQPGGQAPLDESPPEQLLGRADHGGQPRPDLAPGPERTELVHLVDLLGAPRHDPPGQPVPHPEDRVQPRRRTESEGD